MPPVLQAARFSSPFSYVSFSMTGLTARRRRRVESVRHPVGELGFVVRRESVDVPDDQVVASRRPRRAAAEEVLAADLGWRSRNGF